MLMLHTHSIYSFATAERIGCASSYNLRPYVLHLTEELVYNISYTGPLVTISVMPVSDLALKRRVC